MEKFLSQRQKENILYDGYKLRKDKILADGSTSWRCSKRHCSGRIKVNQTNEVIIVTEHNHAPDPEGNAASKVVATIRHLAVNTMEKPRQIIQQSTTGISTNVASYLPSFMACQRTIQRQRKQCAIPFHPVNSLADIVISKQLQQTTRNDNFVLWDFGVDDNKRILMFGTAEHLKLLLQYDHWFIDGTFKIAPTIFCQVYNSRTNRQLCISSGLYFTARQIRG